MTSCKAPPQKAPPIKEGFGVVVYTIGGTPPLQGQQPQTATAANPYTRRYHNKKGQTFRSDLEEAATYSPTG